MSAVEQTETTTGMTPISCNVRSSACRLGQKQDRIRGRYGIDACDKMALRPAYCIIADNDSSSSEIAGQRMSLPL